LRTVVVTAPVTLSSAPAPLADWLLVLRWLALVRVVDRLRAGLVLARLRFALEPLARLPPELRERLALDFDALGDRLLPLVERLLAPDRVDCAMGSPPRFSRGRRGARPAASGPRRCDT
jgi:hypothetical protein